MTTREVIRMANGTEGTDTNSQAKHDLSLVLMSTFSFLVTRYLLYLCAVLPKSLNSDHPEKFYWFNVLTSLIHSIISGVWCLICFYKNPDMILDLIHKHDASAHALVAMSTGYFIYDVIDNLYMLPFSKSWEIVLHHVVVISCFGLAVFRHEYIGYAVLSLLVEINSVFLHTRQLLRLAHAKLETTTYKVNSIANLFSFVLFRIFTLAYMTHWISVQNEVPQPFFGIGATGMFIMTVLNAVLFFRLLVKDCFGYDPKRKTKVDVNGSPRESEERNGAVNHAKQE